MRKKKSAAPKPKRVRKQFKMVQECQCKICQKTREIDQAKKEAPVFVPPSMPSKKDAYTKVQV